MVHSRFVLLLPVLLLTQITAARAQDAASPHVIVLRAARLLDVENGRIVRPGEVLINGEHIAAVGQNVKHPAGAEVIDLGDRTLLPGMIDAHIHLFLHPGAEDCRPFRVESSTHNHGDDRRTR
jgi:hypothetical protein